MLWPKYCFYLSEFLLPPMTHQEPPACSCYTQTGHKVGNRQHNILSYQVSGIWNTDNEIQERQIRNQLEKEKNLSHSTDRTDNICTKENVTTVIQSEKKMSVEKQDYAPSGSRNSTFFPFLKTCEYCLGKHREVIGFQSCGTEIHSGHQQKSFTSLAKNTKNRSGTVMGSNHGDSAHAAVLKLHKGNLKVSNFFFFSFSGGVFFLASALFSISLACLQSALDSFKFHFWVPLAHQRVKALKSFLLHRSVFQVIKDISSWGFGCTMFH